jgi:hypothetical protein
MNSKGDVEGIEVVDQSDMALPTLKKLQYFDS